MSAYKSYTPRRPTESAQTSTSDKLKGKVEKLQELFPKWSNEDLLSVLTETVGDVELAVTRISEGHAEQWGSVTRKKEKKNPQHSQSTSSFSQRGDRDRPSGDSRGGRGGRGGRGRGGGSRGTPRGAHASSHQRETGTSTSASNGIAAPVAEAAPVSNDSVTGTDTAAPRTDGSVETKVNGVGAGAGEPWGAKIAHEPTPEGWTAPTEAPMASSSATSWGVEPAAETTPAPAWATDDVPQDTWASPAQNGSTELAKAKAQVKTSKIPPGAKLSWAQIARAQEKPKSVVPPPSVLPSAPLAPLAIPVPTEPVPPDAVEEVPLTEEQRQGWEEPTTVQPPSWDDEPTNAPPQAVDSQISTHDGWITAETVPPPVTPQEAWDTSATFSPPRQDATTQDSNWTLGQPGELASVPSPQETTPSVVSLAPVSSTASATTSTAPTSKPSTPSIAHASARPMNAHRASARYPKSDQAVVIPAFAGSIGTGSEKLGMQFGSLSIGGEDNFDGNLKIETESSAPSLPEPQQQLVQPQPAQTSTQTQSYDAVSPPAAPVSTHSQNFFQQSAQPTPSVPAVSVPAQQIQSPPQPPQPPQPQQSQQSTTSGPPFGTHQPPPALTHQQQQQQLAQQHQPQSQHSYTQQQQHGIHTHFDGPPVPQLQQQQTQQQTQHATGPQTGSYFRQAESPYYHNPTPPQSAPPDHQGAYGTTFSPLGVGAGAHAHAQGLGGQGQGGHLGGFGAGGPTDYGYGDGQRGFYDYAQPGSFSNRLVHDEPSKGGLPLSQGTQPASSLGSPAAQPQASTGPQGSSGQPPAGQQGQQQGYPAPMPYYYPPYYPQNSYPTYPNPSYGQAYMPKYPPVYPHQAPVGPGSAPPPAGKGPSATAPYSASVSQNHLYHGQGGFEDPTAGYQHHSTSLGNADYQKQSQHHQQQQPLYGAQAAQGLQSFLGIQQTPSSGQGVGGPGGQQRSGTSPETSYKPYGTPGGASDKSGAGLSTQPGQQGRTAGVQQAQQQSGGAGSFYPGGRFSGGAGGPQQQGQQQGQGYPQSGDQGQFYPYQPRHQGGYWQ